MRVRLKNLKEKQFHSAL